MKATVVGCRLSVTFGLSSQPFRVGGVDRAEAFLPAVSPPRWDRASEQALVIRSRDARSTKAHT